VDRLGGCNWSRIMSTDDDGISDVETWGSTTAMAVCIIILVNN